VLARGALPYTNSLKKDIGKGGEYFYFSYFDDLGG
jgi:hypothetical protein